MDSRTDGQRPHGTARPAADAAGTGRGTSDGPVATVEPDPPAEATGRRRSLVPGQPHGRAAALVGTAALLLAAGTLAALLRNRPGGLTSGLLLAALGVAAVAGVLVAVRGLLRATAPASSPVSPARAGALRAAGFLALAAALLAGGAGVSAVLTDRPVTSAKETLVVSYQDGPDGSGLLVLHARVPGLDAGAPWRADLFRRADGVSAVPAFRVGVVPADGVLEVELRQLAPGAEDLTLRLDAAPVSCIAPIRFSSVGDVPQLRCSGRRTGR